MKLHHPFGTPRTRSRRRPGTRTKVVILVLAALLVLPTISFVQAMTYPGSAPASVRAVEWVRDHGGGPIVDRIETWMYTRNAPAARGKPSEVLTLPTATGPSSLQGGQGVLPPAVPVIAARLPGEGAWHVVRRATDGTAALSLTWFRVDPSHLPVSVAAAVLNQRATALHLGGGTREPKVGYFAPVDSRVPSGDRSALAAVFNAGFKMRDTKGAGWYRAGVTVIPPAQGMASLVIDSAGRASVGAWGSDVRMTSGVSAVRQNLHLIVQDQQPVAGLGTNNQGLFGTGKNQFQYTWRSGIGTNRAGDLVYVAGSKLTLHTLASALAQAGAVTAMELDIHSHQVAFNYFLSPNEARAATGHNLLAGMQAPVDRYLVADQRDFFYATLR